jgi:hypothetical protein
MGSVVYGNIHKTLIINKKFHYINIVFILEETQAKNMCI